MKEITLYLQPKNQKQVKKEFSKGKIIDYDYPYVFKIETIIVFIIVICVFPIIIIVNTYLNGYLSTAFNFSLLISCMLVGLLILSKVGLFPSYIIPEEYILLMEMQYLQHMNPKIIFKKKRILLGLGVNWEVKIITNSTQLTFTYIFLSGLEAQFSGAGMDPINNIIVLNIIGDEKEITKIARYLLNKISIPWEIVRKKQFEKQFNISVSEVKQSWMSFLTD